MFGKLLLIALFVGSVSAQTYNSCYPNPCNRTAFCSYDYAAGGYTCTCRDGYIANGTTCVNVCTPGNPCKRYNAYCTSDFNRRHRVCRCRYGFVKNNGSEFCQNPCDLKPCDKNAYCDRYRSHDRRCSCNTGFVGNGLECFRPPKCMGLGTSWSPFYNRDFPTGACDCETFAYARVDYPKTICANPINVDVVDAVTNLDYRVNKQVVTVNTALEKGFTCFNRDQKNNTFCRDYKIRYCCKIVHYQQPKYKNLIPILVPAACVLGIGLIVGGVLFYRSYKRKRPSPQTEQHILQNVF
uniref:delta-like protein B isoform X2 n=1 Tax=Ciona intestinalis TaxID=7719 RepID=UPI00089DB923|nr:delta-like protein B isoform X2 [Ciona intestinalis]|eukprot:XP_018668167.1 delta-like protein B isoform X2 [Ciona intestinalis]